MKNYKFFLIILTVIAIELILFWKIPELRLSMTGKVASSSISNTTATVSIGGLLGDIVAVNNPINFTIEPGLQPRTSLNPKQGIGYITVTPNSSNNVNYNISINATNLVVTVGGYSIPVANVSVNSTCNRTAPPAALTRLSNSLQVICSNVYRYNSTNIYFYLDVPAGQYNGTYFGNVTVYLNTSENSDNKTWVGTNNLTVAIKQYIEFQWNTSNTPIDFGTLNPGVKSNASSSTEGFPASVIDGTGTNVFLDIYINGTNLNCLSGACIPGTHYIGVGNMSYSNATSVDAWPDSVRALSLTMSGTSGDFGNWNNVRNATNVYSFWNISVPSLQVSGNYGGNIYAKAVEDGQTP